MFDIPVRSGLVNAVLEVLVVFLVLPLWSSGLVNIVNRNTFRNARMKGHGVNVGQGIPSLSNPFHLFKTRAVGNKLLLIGEVVIAVIIFWLEIGVNGKTEGLYNMETRFVLNGGSVPDMAPISDVTRLRKISGLSSQSRSCFRQIEQNTYELYGVSYAAPQNFESSISQEFGFNESKCLDPDEVQSSVGLRFVADYHSIVQEHDMNTTRFKKGRLPDGLVDGYLYQSCEGSLFGVHTFTVLGPYLQGSRIMVTATKEKENQFLLEIGGIVNLEENDPNDYTISERDFGTSSCAHLNYTRMIQREFEVMITTMNTELEIRNLARAVSAYLWTADTFPGRGVYRGYDAVDLMAELFISAEPDSEEDQAEVIGQFKPMEVRVKQKEGRKVTEISLQSAISAAIVVVFVLLGLTFNILVDNQGRDITSVAWTHGVVRSHYENLGRCWNKTTDVSTYWVQLREGWTAHFGPEGYGYIVRPVDGIRDEDITGCRRRNTIARTTGD